MYINGFNIGNVSVLNVNHALAPSTWAASNGDLPMAEMLVSRGANPNAQTLQNELPEELCPRENRLEFRQLLEPAR